MNNLVLEVNQYSIIKCHMDTPLREPGLFFWSKGQRLESLVWKWKRSQESHPLSPVFISYQCPKCLWTPGSGSHVCSSSPSSERCFWARCHNVSMSALEAHSGVSGGTEDRYNLGFFPGRFGLAEYRAIVIRKGQIRCFSDKTASHSITSDSTKCVFHLGEKNHSRKPVQKEAAWHKLHFQAGYLSSRKAHWTKIWMLEVTLILSSRLSNVNFEIQILEGSARIHFQFKPYSVDLHHNLRLLSTGTSGVLVSFCKISIG